MTADHIEVRLRLYSEHLAAAEEALLALGALGTAHVSLAVGGDPLDAARYEDFRSSPIPPGTADQPGSRATPGPDGAPDRRAFATAGRVLLSGYFPPDPAPTEADVRAAVERSLPAGPGTGPTPKRPDLAIEVVARPAVDWIARTRARLRPERVTPHLWIAPPEAPAPVAPAAQLLITPGSAFGAGTHSTTRGCLQLLDDDRWYRTRSGAALDIGTGTGILALRARQHGYAPVYACDLDPQAAAVARDNAAGNRLRDRLHVLAGTVEALRPRQPYVLILANLFLLPILALLPRLAEELAAEGALILSGTVSDDRDQLVAGLLAAGLRPVTELHDDGWMTLGARAADARHGRQMGA